MKGHVYANNTGRGSEIVMGKFGKNMPQPPLPTDSTKLFAQLTPSGKDYLNTPWIWREVGSHKQVGLEVFALSSCRAVLEGQRVVILVEFSSLAKFVILMVLDGGLVSLARIVDTVCNASEEFLKKMLETVTMYHAVCGPGSALMAPWGCIV